jgi:hypothetical protein
MWWSQPTYRPHFLGKHEAQGWAPKRPAEGEAAPHRTQAQPHGRA